jgi:hypothetical protein
MELKTKLRLVTEISPVVPSKPAGKGHLKLVSPAPTAPVVIATPNTGSDGKRDPDYLGPGMDIEPDVLAKYEATGKWAGEHKIDGMWSKFIVGNPSEGKPNVLSSRDATTPVISGANLGDLDTLQTPWPEGSVLIGELEAATEWATEQANAKGYRSLHLYDVVRVGHQSAMPLPWHQRRALLEAMHAKISGNDDLHSRLPLLSVSHGGFAKLYEETCSNGGEGIVLKAIDSIYNTHRADGKADFWVRCKRWFTMDYVLFDLGKTPGGTLTGIWGLFRKGKLTRTMQASCPTEFLLPENVGKLVVEFKGWRLFKSGALRHASYSRVRTDKGATECVL